MTQPRLLHIIQSLEMGGTERQLLLLLPQLQLSVANEVVCVMGQGPIGQALAAKGITVHYLNGHSPTDWRIPWRLWRLLRRQRPHAIVTYFIYADIVGRVVGRLARVPIIIASQRSSLFGPTWWHRLDRGTRRLVTHYTSQTQATKELLHRVLKVPLAKITVIPNAVTPPALPQPTQLRLKLHIASEAAVIICVANLKPEKDLPTLLAAFEQAYTHYPTSHLWLVGEGGERAKLQQQVTAYTSRENIHFLGSRADVSNLLAESTIFVLPSQIEGMSNALLEAQASGLPCIASAIPANAALITPGQTGLLFQTGNVQDLTQQLTFLQDNPAIRVKLGTAAQQAARVYTLDNVTQQWLKLFQMLKIRP